MAMPKVPEGLTYAGSGVNIDAGNELVQRIKAAAASTKRPGANADLGGFGGVIDLKAAGFSSAPKLVQATDGVGTKLKIASAMNKHDTVGIDLVAINVNDLLDIQDGLPQILEENGFRDLNHLKWYVPLGPWLKDTELKRIGLHWWVVFHQELEALTLLPLMEGLVWDYGRYQTFLMNVRLELNRWARLRMVTELHVFHAQKASN